MLLPTQHSWHSYNMAIATEGDATGGTWPVCLTFRGNGLGDMLAFILEVSADRLPLTWWLIMSLRSF